MLLKVLEDSLDYALAHILARGDTDVLPHAHEFVAIQAMWTEVRTYLSGVDLDTWSSRPLRTCLSPKRGLSFRIATQLDPFDTLLLTAIVFELGADLESSRVPVSENTVHSYRFLPLPSGQLFRPDYTFESFRERSLSLAHDLGGYVLMTDIADFFHRLYHHPLENALDAATSRKDHVRCLTKLIANWNQSVSHGVPVGPSAIRLLAEVAIDDVDRALLSEGYHFCRFSDDYRIFVETEVEARRACAFLASTLFRHHGLTLQESKTEILPADVFMERFERTEENETRNALAQRLDQFVSQLRIRQLEASTDDPAENEPSDEAKFSLPRPIGGIVLDDYEFLEYETLDQDEKDFVDSLNLWEILRLQIEGSGPLDVALTRFVLRRITQLQLSGDYRLLLEDLKRTYVIFPEIVAALAMHGEVHPAERLTIGDALLKLIDDPIVGHLEYHRSWVISVFNDRAWNHQNQLMKLFNAYSDQITRPQVVAALGDCGAAHWFRGKKADIALMPPWERRAFLAGVRCLPKDEAKHWVKSVRPQLDPLEAFLARWAAAQAAGPTG